MRKKLLNELLKDIEGLNNYILDNVNENDVEDLDFMISNIKETIEDIKDELYDIKDLMNKL